MRVGITGWRGFIGSHLAQRISNPVLFQGDMRNLADVKKFVGQCDRIYHIAGKNRAGSGKILANNLVATSNLVLATQLLVVNPEIVFSSSKQTKWNFNSEYGMTEYGMAKMVEEYIVRKAAKWSIFRIPNVYGPGCKPFYNSVVATFCYQIAHNEPRTIHQPSATREFIFIDDLISAMTTKFLLHLTIDIAGEVLSVQEVYDYLTTRLGEHEKLKRTLDWYKENKNDIPATRE